MFARVHRNGLRRFAHCNFRQNDTFCLVKEWRGGERGSMSVARERERAYFPVACRLLMMGKGIDCRILM